LALALAASAAFASDAPRKTDSDVSIRMEERGIRAAGIGVVPVERERGSSDLTLPGTVAIPQQQIRIVAAPAAGLVEAMLIAADEHVTAGQPIARVRSPAIVEAQLQFLSAISDDALAQDKLRRSQLLYEGRALPERELRVAETEAVRAKSHLDERTQILGLMEMSEAEVEKLRKTRKIVSTVTVYSPISGTVVTRHTSAGERVDATAPLFTIAQLEPLWVNIQVPANRLSNIIIGAPVVLPASGARGRIIRIARTVDAPTQSATAVAEIDTNGGRVRPGLAVAVNVRVDASGDQPGADQWSVPNSSVVRHRDRTWVFVRKPDGFRARPVQVVAEAGRGVLIRGDLVQDDQVASRGMLSLLSALAEADKD
jgi:RND family efflux transporter MFP subunit